MSKRLLLLLGMPALLAGPAMAQQPAPNPNQAAAKTLLQAADKAIGASTIKSWSVTATGWMGYPGQQFAQGDLPRTDLKSFSYTVDYPSKSAKWEYVRVQGIVRPIDIEPDNTISSLKVADAMIAYGGKGPLASANSPGLLSRFFNLPFLPF